MKKTILTGGRKKIFFLWHALRKALLLPDLHPPPPCMQLLNILSMCGREDLSVVLMQRLRGWCLITLRCRFQKILQTYSIRVSKSFSQCFTNHIIFYACYRSKQKPTFTTTLSNLSFLSWCPTTILNEWVVPRHQCGGTNPTQRWILYLREPPLVW